MAASAPRFHVRVTSCRLIDPNGPFFDPVHGLYHLFWQAHETETHAASSGNGTVCGGPVWGHAVSRNLSHWTHLPVALWNDEWFDLHAVYSGSTTIVGSAPVVVYPGICDKTHALCPQSWGVTLVAAVPANSPDPFYETWEKRTPGPAGSASDNPLLIGNEPLKDPSAAWKTSRGEWRLTTAGGQVYSSWDYRHWVQLQPPKGVKTLFHGGECPSFFALPKLVHGREKTGGEELPTHVFKYSSDGSRDFVVTGTYNEGEPNTTGSWTPAGPARVVDNGAFYAGKDMGGPGGRRILWGWARVPGTLSLARELSYDPVLRQLCYNPLLELAALRAQPPLLNLSDGFALAPGTQRSLGNWSGSVGDNSSEVWVRFKIPAARSRSTLSDESANVTFGVGIMTSDKPPHAPSHLAFVEYQPPAAGATGVFNATVGVRPPPATTTATSITSDGSGGGATDTLQLTPEDTVLDVRVFFDGHFAEIFVMGGRVAMTVPVPATTSAGFTVFVEGNKGAAGVRVVGAEAYHMGSIWISKAQVLNG